MSKTVYVEVTSNYSRSTWDDLGSTNYNPGDRVDYFDGSRNRIFVCINSNNSTTEPQNNPTDWAPAGSEQYPFLLIDSTNNLRLINNSEWTIHGHSSSTVNFLVEELGTWILTGTSYAGDAQGATIILGDGRYTWDYTTYAMWWPNNCTIQAKNKHKAYIITNCQYWGGNNVVWKDVVIYSSSTTNTIPGAYSAERKHSLDSCLMTQETPWGNLSSLKQEPSTTTWTRAIYGTWGGGYIRNCTIDYQYRGPSFWIDLSSASKQGVFENNTFYARVKHNQYNAIYNARQSVFKNNIFYFKYLMDGHTSQNFAASTMSTEGVNTFYLENDSDVGGTLNNNIPGGVTINPLFIDADKSNFALRPQSPLIGGYNENSGNPEGVWFDSNHSPTSQTLNFSLDSGNGTNYTFSGDATGSDPVITAGTGDTLVFTNNTGGHPIGILDPDGNLIATESGGSLTFSTLQEGTYRYECQAPHPNMGNSIIINKNVGSYTNPINDLISGIGVNHTLLIKNGTHNLTRQVLDFPTANLKIIGESPKSTVLIFTGSNYGGAIDCAREGDSESLSVENLTLLWDSTVNCYGIFLTNDLNINSCIFKTTQKHLSSGADTRGWFAGHTNGHHANITNSTISGKSSANLIFGGDYAQKGFNSTTIRSCTFIALGPIQGFYSNSSSGLLSPINFHLESTIHIGFDATEYLTTSNSSPLSGSNNFYYNFDSTFGTALPGDINSPEPPGFISDDDLRLRPSSQLIGGSMNKNFAADSVWVRPGSGIGTGTKDDAFYWSQYSDAFLAAAQTTSKQVIFKDGEYLWTSTILQDDNVGNSITMVAENMHQAIFYDNGRISSSGKGPTLRFTGIQLEARDHFTWQPECHYVLESCHFLIRKYIGALSVTAKGCIFEVAPGYNMTIFSNTGPVQIENCIFADHNDFTPNSTYLTNATSGTLKNCIFYCKSARDTALASYGGASLVSCATVNITNPEDGVEFIDNVQFVNVDAKDYSLRPSSPLIGQGT